MSKTDPYGYHLIFKTDKKTGIRVFRFAVNKVEKE